MKKLFLLSLMLSALNTLFAQYIVPPTHVGQLDTLRDARKKTAPANGGIELVTQEDFDGFNWLEGTWVSIDSAKDLSTEERWVKTESYWLEGSRYTLSGKDTTTKEMFAFYFEGLVYYGIVTKMPWVYYDITYLSGNGFILENINDTFPKKIVYGRVGKRLRVTLSGNGLTKSYLFERKGA